MRAFEIVLILANLFSLVLLFKRPGKGVLIGAVAANLAACLAHRLVEGHRPQMVFSYIFVIAFTLYALGKLRYGLFRARAPLGLRVGAAVAAVVGLGLSAFLAYALPVFNLPKPGGDYVVGVRYLHLVDEGRSDPFLQPSTQPRELMVKLYYPAAPDASKPYLRYFNGSPELARIFAGFYHMPEVLFSHLTLVKTHAKAGLAVAGEGQPYPVVIFSHGAGASMEVQTAQSEDLASRGYIVAAIDHTYVSAGTVFPNRVVEHHDATTNFDVAEPAEVITQIMADDARFVIDRLAELNEGKLASGFAGRLDLERIGAIGHSVGGATAYNLAISEPRVKAAINLDGVVYLTPGEGEEVAPVLMLASDQLARAFEEQKPLMPSLEELPTIDHEIMVSIHGSEEDYRAAYERARQNHLGLSRVVSATGTLFTIRGSEHMKFTDIGLFIGDPRLREMIKIGGATDPARCLEISQEVTAAFFDQYLKGQPAGLDAVLGRYGELERIGDQALRE